MYPHRIRLREPWDREQLASGDMRFQRSFGRPGQIDSHERLWLTVSNAPAEGTLSVNGQQLGSVRPGTSVEFEVTDVLARRNQLLLFYPNHDGSAGITGDVALEIRCAVFLRNIQCRFDDARRLHVACEVIGSWDSSLELYALVNDRTAIYTPVTAGSPSLELQSEEAFPLSDKPVQVRVEVTKGATVWFRWEAAI